MARLRVLRPVTVAALMLGASACAVIPHQTHWVRTTPVTTSSKLTPADTDYAAAAAAINRRDYGLALDYLQAARARDARDIRVLNAFGVVYDKLGRFDLSARYYAQAKAIDQTSAIISNNIAYSGILQRQGAPNPTLAARSAAPSPPRLATVRPAILHVDLSTQKPTMLILAKTAIHPLVIVDASGRQNGAGPVRLSLAQLGWSMAKSPTTTAPTAPRTTILYPEASKAIALALARTLPSRPQLVSCSRLCTRMRLVVGTDAANWRLGRRSSFKQGLS